MFCVLGVLVGVFGVLVGILGVLVGVFGVLVGVLKMLLKHRVNWMEQNKCDLGCCCRCWRHQWQPCDNPILPSNQQVVGGGKGLS